MKYTGSKNRIAKELVPVIQSYITSETKGYLEPFVGGANMIDKIDCSKKYGCDINEYLIELLKYVTSNSNCCQLKYQTKNIIML
ncbi:MAG: DNA adenine methylase [Lachnospiraceae bacterium]|nr:DNA adenine methylase [Lachnospiraceae bacterium]